MKQLAFLIFILSGIGCSQEKEKSTAIITGELNNVKDSISMLKFSYLSNDSLPIQDSAKIVNGKYSIIIPLSRPQLISFAKFPLDKKDTYLKEISRDVFIEPGEITITSNNEFENLKVKGSKSNDEFVKFRQLEKPYHEALQNLINQELAYRDSLSASSGAKEGAISKSERDKNWESMEDSLRHDNYEKIMFPYLEKNPNSPIAFYLVYEFAINRNLMRTPSYFYKLPKDVQNSPQGKYLKKMYDRHEATAIGKLASDITANDTSGKKVSLSDLKGKYVLLEFWANWCGYCRHESPFMNKAFKKYQSKNFTILSVSLDKEEDKKLWKKAIVDDHNCWLNISDLKGWESPLIDTYGIIGIPMNLLIDPDGKILARDLRGEKLEESLHLILDK